MTAEVHRLRPFHVVPARELDQAIPSATDEEILNLMAQRNSGGLPLHGEWEVSEGDDAA